MTNEQVEWLDSLHYLNPHWAKEEFDLRGLAKSIHESLLRQGIPAYTVRISLGRPVASFFDPDAPYPSTAYENITLTVYRLGNEQEERLMIEEGLRRAYAGTPW